MKILTEMATIAISDEFKLKIIVNPDLKRVGDPYFKLYSPAKNSSHVARLGFCSPKVIYHRNRGGLKNLEITESLIRKIHKFLEETWSTNSLYTNWEAAKYYWNLEYGLIPTDIQGYIEGKYDEELKTNPSYVSSSQTIPLTWR